MKIGAVTPCQGRQRVSCCQQSDTASSGLKASLEKRLQGKVGQCCKISK